MTCKVENCYEPVHIKKRGLCEAHYGQWWRAQHPEYMKQYAQSGATLKGKGPPQQEQLPFLR